jgi:hypothetical protein
MHVQDMHARQNLRILLIRFARVLRGDSDGLELTERERGSPSRASWRQSSLRGSGGSRHFDIPIGTEDRQASTIDFTGRTCPRRRLRHDAVLGAHPQADP